MRHAKPASRPSGRGLGPGLTAVLVMALAVGVALVPESAVAKRAEDDEVLVNGTVIDATGAAVPGVTVELRGTHWAFSMRDFRIKKRGSRKASAETGADGAFEIHWSWHPYYDRFDLVAGVRLGPPETSEELLELGRVDLSRRMRQGDPVVATVEIEDRAPADQLREFLDQVDTEAERQVYQEMGKPDKVRHTTFPSHEESSWWYFEQGKVYRFRDGEKDAVDRFEPIPADAG